MKQFDFNKENALQKGSMEVFHQLKLGEVYSRKNFRWCAKPVMTNGHDSKLRALKIRNAVKTPVAHKHYDITFRIVFLTYATITIDILELEPTSNS